MLLAPTVAALLALAAAAAPTSSPLLDLRPSSSSSPNDAHPPAPPRATGSTIQLSSRPRHVDDSWNPDLRLLRSQLSMRSRYAGWLDDAGREGLRRDWGDFHEYRGREVKKLELWKRDRRKRGNNDKHDGKQAEVETTTPAQGYPTVLANWKADRIYSLPVLIGTPAQQFAVTIDTGSAALWVYGAACNSSLCAGSEGYDPYRSSTAGEQAGDMEIKYGQGSTLGHWITDTVSLGGWAITGFEFGLAHTVNDQPWEGTDTSGILGLSWGMSGWAAPFWQTLAVQNAFADPRFGLYLARERDTRESAIDGRPSHEAVGGSLTLGGVDAQVIDGDITYLDVKETHGSVTFWRIASDGYVINGHSEPAPVDAIIDSGTSFIYLPTEDHRRFWSLVPGSVSMPLEEYGANWARYFAFPCQNTSVIHSLDLAFKFAGIEWKIQSTDLIYQPIQQGSLNGYCIGAVLDGTGIVDNFDGAWLVGDAFLKNVYSVYTYEPPRVGFAKLKADFDLRIEGMDWVDRTPGANKTLSPPPVGINQQTPTSVVTVPAARTDGSAKNRILSGARRRVVSGWRAALASITIYIITII